MLCQSVGLYYLSIGHWACERETVVSRFSSKEIAEDYEKCLFLCSINKPVIGPRNNNCIVVISPDFTY